VTGETLTPAQFIAKLRKQDVDRLTELEKRIEALERHHHYGHSSRCDGPTGGPVIPDE
jgi:hypothetical protein